MCDTKSNIPTSILIDEKYIDEIKKMKMVSRNHKSAVYEKDGIIYKLFDDSYVKNQGEVIN